MLADLGTQLLSALGCTCLERQRSQALADLRLQITSTVDIDPNPFKLELGTVAALLKPAALPIRIAAANSDSLSSSSKPIAGATSTTF